MDSVWSWLSAHWVISLYLAVGIPITGWLILDRWFISLDFLALSTRSMIGIVFVTWILWLPALALSAWIARADAATESRSLPEPHPSTDHRRQTGRGRYFERPPDPPSAT